MGVSLFWALSSANYSGGTADSRVCCTRFASVFPLDSEVSLPGKTLPICLQARAILRWAWFYLRGGLRFFSGAVARLRELVFAKH